MFYATQIKSLAGDFAIDTQGRSLQFIGYLPVSEGDWVYTDGKIIFGNAPPKDAPLIVDEQSGIPVLGDKDSVGNTLRGYFDMRGKYKKYTVAQDNWIVNSKKKFNHGEEYFNDIKVIDAEIIENGDKFVVTGGIYHDSRTLNTARVKCLVGDMALYSIGWSELPVVHNRFAGFFQQLLGSNDFPNWKEYAQIFRNDSVDETLDLQPYAEDIEARALVAAQKIMEHDYTKEDVEANDLRTILVDVDNAGTAYEYNYYETYSYLPVEQFIKNFSSRLTSDMAKYGYDTKGVIDGEPPPSPDKPFIAYTTAYILSCNVGDNGFDGIVFATTYGYCFPHIKPRFVKAKFSSPSFCHLYEWKCTPFGVSCLYRINSDEIKPIACRNFGGIDSDLIVIKDDAAVLWNVTNGTALPKSIMTVKDTRHITLLSGLLSTELDEQFLLPVGQGFYRMDKFGRLSFFDSKRQSVAVNIPVHEDFCHIEILHGEYDSSGFNADFNDKPLLNCKIYRSNGNVTETVIYIADDDNTFVSTEQGFHIDSLAPVDGYYILANGILEPLQFTPLFYQFKNGTFLFGVKGGKLYYKDKDGEISLVGDGLKNFRLRELKNLSKAKK